MLKLANLHRLTYTTESKIGKISSDPGGNIPDSGICMAAYARMGMSEKNMKHIENEFVEDQCNESHEGRR